MSFTFLVLNGPNLNLLGAREPAVYGSLTWAQIEASVRAEAVTLGGAIEVLQSNHEGVLIDALHAAPERFHGVVFNPSAFTHTSIALRDAVAAIDLPVIEVHLTNVHRREPYRRISYVAETATATISGAGVDSYLLAVNLLARRLGAPA